MTGLFRTKHHTLPRHRLSILHDRDRNHFHENTKVLFFLQEGLDALNKIEKIPDEVGFLFVDINSASTVLGLMSHGGLC